MYTLIIIYFLDIGMYYFSVFFFYFFFSKEPGNTQATENIIIYYFGCIRWNIFVFFFIIYWEGENFEFALLYLARPGFFSLLLYHYSRDNN